MRRWILLFVLVAGLVAGSKLLFENVLGLSLERIASTWLDAAGPGSAAAIVLLLAADVFLPVPSSLIMVLSGAAFGVAWGSVFSLVGSIAGEWFGFELVRRYGRRASSALVGDDELARLGAFFERYGIAAIVLTRPLPIVMETMSVVAGLSAMRRWTFIMASVAGTAPIVVVYAYAGARARDVGSLLPAVVMLVAVAGVGWLIYQSMTRGGSTRQHESG
jgi:uncharacterized membrane protein YdjX (TVP38/TMEM64 family)